MKKATDAEQLVLLERALIKHELEAANLANEVARLRGLNRAKRLVGTIPEIRLTHQSLRAEINVGGPCNVTAIRPP